MLFSLGTMCWSGEVALLCRPPPPPLLLVHTEPTLTGTIWTFMTAVHCLAAQAHENGETSKLQLAQKRVCVKRERTRSVLDFLSYDALITL